jgi:hypothetical protein
LDAENRHGVMALNIQKRNARFIWADKTALALAIVFFLGLSGLWLFAFCVVGPLGTAHLFRRVGAPGIELDLLIAGAFWAFLRSVDFAAGGSTYRLFAARPRQITPALQIFPIPDARRTAAMEAPGFTVESPVVPQPASA